MDRIEEGGAQEPDGDEEIGEALPAVVAEEGQEADDRGEDGGGELEPRVEPRAALPVDAGGQVRERRQDDGGERVGEDPRAYRPVDVQIAWPP